jgi:hypothetical protein
MLIPSYFVFLAVLAASVTGWGALAVPRRSAWPGRFGAGTLVVFFLMASAGWLGLLDSWLIWLVMAAGLLLWFRPGKFSIPRGLGLLSMAGLLILPLVMMAPVSRDAMIHHLYQARLWLSAGRIVRPEWSGFFSYPYLTETLYSLAGGTFGFRLSRAVSFLGFLAACSVPVTCFLKRGRRKEAVISLLVLLSIPELVRNATWSYSDSFTVFFALLAYAEMQKRDGNPAMALVWGAAAGCCKYNGFLVLLSVAALIPFMHRDIPRRTLFVSAGLALFISAWWALPNLLQWGNPVYPLFRGILGPEHHVSQRAAGYFAALPFGSSLRTVIDYLLLPVRMSLHGRWDDPFFFDGASGPLLLSGAIISLPVLRDRRRKFLLPMLYLMLTVISKGGSVRTRYMLPGLAMLSIPVSQALGLLLTDRGRLTRWAVMVLMAGCLAWSGLRIASLYSGERPWEFPTDQEYLERRLPQYGFFTECGNYISSSDTTLMVNIGRVFYFPGYAVFDEERAPVGLLEMFWSGMEADEVRDSLSREGVSHIAMDMFLTSINVPPVLSEEELVHWRKFVSLELVPVVTVDDFVLFRLRR